MLLTKEIYDQIKPGEIFKVVTTRLHEFEGAMERPLTFVCVKAKTAPEEEEFLWSIYYSRAGSQPEDVARYGAKVPGVDNVLSICPCDEVVLELYRFIGVK